MKLALRLLAALVVCAAGCSGMTHLRTGAEGKTVANELRAARAGSLMRLNAPCEIKVHSAERMGSQDYTYPFKPLLTAALNDALYEVFVPPGRDVLESFRAEIDVYESVLTTRGSRADYRLVLLGCLRHPNGRIVFKERIEKREGSRFNKQSLPDAFWRTIYDAAYDLAAKVSNDRTVRHVAAPRDPTADVPSGSLSKRLSALVAKAVKGAAGGCAKGATLAVTNVRTNISGNSTIVDFVTAEMEGSAALRDAFTLVERSRIKQVLLELERQRNLIYDQQTVAEVGKLVNAKYLLTSDLFLLDGVLTLFVKVVEVERGVTVSSARSSVRVQ